MWSFSVKFKATANEHDQEKTQLRCCEDILLPRNCHTNIKQTNKQKKKLLTLTVSCEKRSCLIRSKEKNQNETSKQKKED